MDHIINILVRLFVFLSRFAPIMAKMGLIKYRSFKDPEDDNRLHILLVGYNGAGNTGSDIRTEEIVRQLRSRVGKDRVRISVMTLDEDSVRGYFDDDVDLIHFSTVFFLDVFKACCANQAAILCEGSTLKSKFANALTLYFCEAAGIMKNQHKPCIAYGSEAGEMDSFLERTVRKLCKDTYFVARTGNSLDRIHELGLEGHQGTDTSWEFDSASCDKWAVTKLKKTGWDGRSPILGIAPVNPFWWPVRPSLVKWIRALITEDHSLQFGLWYFFSWSDKRRRQFDVYLNSIASSVNKFAAEHSCFIVIFGMERLDADACKRLRSRLTVPASVILSSNHNGYEMTAVLRHLSMLITSRYHAEALAMAAKVPTIAISMDERLDNIMQEMDMCDHQLLHVNDGDLTAELSSALEYVWAHKEQISDKLGYELMRYQHTFDEMGDFLTAWLLSQRDGMNMSS